MIETIKRKPLPDDAPLEAVMKDEIIHLEQHMRAHTIEADRYRQEANRLKDVLRSAGITVR